ncbi:MAG: preprotein translocase subunit SecG [Spirochaetales bacterium]|jgi:preprotein translocase subunit SecG|nr:preprotein translocase subunit SecG [Spirochaetales bacterium]
MIIDIVGIALLVIFVLSALLLMAIVLVQDEQGEGLGGIFGGGSSTPFGGRSGNILTKITSVLAAVFLLTSLALAWINRSPEAGDVPGAAQRQEAGAVDWWVTEEAPSGGAELPGLTDTQE